ncbi:MAG: CpsD/CapB family tyrosine-protein kinase [Pseudomonadota bacterium]
MEKLQAALKTARDARRGADKTHDRSLHGPVRRTQDAAVDNLWESLEAFDPERESLRQHRVVTRDAGRNSTPFDILRTKVLLQMRQNGWTRLAITSPMPRSGKTTTACNLALGFGRQKDLRAMLFDFDLRDPTVHDFFGHVPKNSLTSVLSDETPFAEQALRIGPNVTVSMSNRLDQDPTRLLLSERTAEILDEIQESFKPNVMIFDLPSVLAGDDARAFLKNVDCALIVTRANSTRYSQFDTSEREIAEHTNVLGVVLNACRHTGGVGESGSTT